MAAGDGDDHEENSIPRINRPMEIISIAEASSTFPGFRFSPTDQELIQFYLKRKLQGSENEVEVIPELDICRHEPWDLPAQSVIQSDNEWFFFSPRGRKYPNGSQSRRATDSGYWKATGKERNVKSGSIVIGTKRTLVFHMGRAPRGHRTEWIMHEFCTSQKSQDSMVVFRLKRNKEFQLNNHARRVPLSDGGVMDLSAAFTAHIPIGMPMHGCSNDTDSGESDEQITNELSRHDSSSSKKININIEEQEEKEQEENEEEDCYADIMKDDIIQLDDTSFNMNNKLLSSPAAKSSFETTNHDQNITSRLPFQGTANRRLRLGRPKPRSPSADHFEKNRTTGKVNLNVSEHSSFIRKFPRSTIKLPSIILFLVTLILMVLLMKNSQKLRDVLKFENRQTSLERISNTA